MCVEIKIVFSFYRVEYSSLYMCKSKRGMKREEGKVSKLWTRDGNVMSVKFT